MKMKISLMLRIRIKFENAIERILRLVGCSYTYVSSTGVKTLNPSSVCLNKSIVKKHEIDPTQLYLGIDGLKDEYSLLDTNILDSPHYSLVKRLNGNLQIEESDYVLRMINGSLDERRAIIGYLKDHYFENTFRLAYNSLQEKKYSPIITYQVNGRYYILDGKHRAATAALLGINSVKCVIVEKKVAEKCISEKAWRVILTDSSFSKHKKMYSNLQT